MAVHPLIYNFVTASLDETWVLYDGNAGIVLPEVCVNRSVKETTVPK